MLLYARVASDFIYMQVGPDHIWDQLLVHIQRLIKQWTAIGASLPNRVLLAKALLLSRCYYLLDGNSAPTAILRHISQSILRFVRGPYSNAPYSLLQSSLADGGLNCPSLEVRKIAYDVKFLGDLISGPADTPWRVWTLHDLTRATYSNSQSHLPHLNPLIQTGHTLVRPRKGLHSMSDRLTDAFLSARRVGFDLCGAFPSASAILAMPLYHHPALNKRAFRHYICPGLPSHGISSFDDLMLLLSDDIPCPTCADCSVTLADLSDRVFADPMDPIIQSTLSIPVPHRRAGPYPGCRSCPGPSFHRVSLVSELVAPPPALSNCPSCVRSVAALLAKLGGTHWDPRAPPRVTPSPKVWPTEPAPYGYICAFSAPQSILATSFHMQRPGGKYSMDLYSPFPKPDVNLAPPVTRLINVWTDGSAADNGLEICSAGAAWITDSFISDSAQLSSLPLTNNVAEVSAAIMALLSWPSCPLCIHTDSSFVLHLVNGGLLLLESNGWLNFPWLCRTTSPECVSLAPLFQYFLFLLCSHIGPLSFVKATAHGHDAFNNTADFLANEGRLSGRPFSLSDLIVPSGWVCTSPVLLNTSLAFITHSAVRFLIKPAVLSHKLNPMADKWTYFFGHSFNTKLDIALYIPHLWKLCAPPGLGELLWKSLFGTLPLGRSWHSCSQMGLDFCPCGHCDPMDLFHIFMGCSFFPVAPLYSLVLCPALSEASEKTFHRSVDPEGWFRLWWFPILCFKRLSHCGTNA